MNNYVMTLLLAAACQIAVAQEAPTGSIADMKPVEKKQVAALAGKIDGYIVWSSSRSNSKHDLWMMNADGSGEHQLTKGDNVDWYPRVSSSGRQVLFTRSKSGWVPEGEAEVFDKWDLWMVEIDGSNERKVVDNACWGSFRPTGDSIVFARGSQVFVKDLAGGGEAMIFDASVSLKKGAYAQQPQLSPDGCKLAMTVRGSRRETGIWNVKQQVWYSTGEGCQMEWLKDGKKIMRMNEGQGNGGTEVLLISLDENGKPLDKISGLSIPKQLRFMDLPGRRSHEYFPKTDASGTWLVWCATQFGHEHDIADYELYLWKIGDDKKNGPVRLTFHTGNDRWPDVFIGKVAVALPVPVPAVVLPVPPATPSSPDAAPETTVPAAPAAP